MSAQRIDLSDFVGQGGDLAERLEAAEILDESNPEAAVPGSFFVKGGSTWRMTRQGPDRVAPFWLRFERDVVMRGSRTLEGTIVREQGPGIPFRFPAEMLGDVRPLKKLIAGLLGTGFRTPRGSLDEIRDAWLDASQPITLELTPDFGFSDDGKMFVSQTSCLPEGSARFAAPDHTAARLLGIGKPDPARARSTAAELMDAWPSLFHDPRMVGVLLGIVGWALIAPVMEARTTLVMPLLAFLDGASGAGKTTNARIAACFFGSFQQLRIPVSFGSTALAIEHEGYWFRGGLLVVGDVKASSIPEGGESKVLGLIQRAGDRAGRSSMTTAGTMREGLPSRATWLFEGEDVPVTESSALARLTIFKMEAAARRPEAVRRTEALLPSLPLLTGALVENLLREDHWTRLYDRYQEEADAGTARLSGVVNGPRVAKSAAAILCGYYLMHTWMNEQGISAPVTISAVRDLLTETLAQQMGEVEQASPGERMMALIRELLSCRAASLGDGPGECIGVMSEDGKVAFIWINAVMGTIARRFPTAAKTLPSTRSIGADLKRRGLLALSEEGRIQRKRYMKDAGKGEWTWPLRAELLDEGDG